MLPRAGLRGRAVRYFPRAFWSFLAGAMDYVGYYGYWVDVGERTGLVAHAGWGKAKLPHGLVGRSVFRVSDEGWDELGEILYVQDGDPSVFAWVLFVRSDGTLGKVSLGSLDIRVDNDALRDIRTRQSDP